MLNWFLSIPKYTQILLGMGQTLWENVRDMRSILSFLKLTYLKLSTKFQVR